MGREMGFNLPRAVGKAPAIPPVYSFDSWLLDYASALWHPWSRGDYAQITSVIFLANHEVTSMETEGPMRLWVRMLLLLMCTSTLLLQSPCARGQQEEGKRKMVTRVVPNYPSLARKMGIAGSVKIEALVAPNGTVKSAGILGGHPVLAQAGIDAVQKCKWEPSAHETKEVVILNFHPQ